MKYMEKETIEREIEETESGFKFVTERRMGEIYEKNESQGEPEKELEQTGGSNAYDERIVTPDGEELENLDDVFEWFEENGDRFQETNLTWRGSGTTVFPQSSWEISTRSGTSSSDINVSDL